LKHETVATEFFKFASIVFDAVSQIIERVIVVDVETPVTSFDVKNQHKGLTIGFISDAFYKTAAFAKTKPTNFDFAAAAAVKFMMNLLIVGEQTNKDFRPAVSSFANLLTI
jgi:hypothetical protein